MSLNEEKKSFYKEIMVIAIPIVIQNLIGMGLNMIDTIMIGRVGANELAAVGLANRIYFIFSMICFGIYSGASVLIAQYFGVHDIKSIRKVHGLDLLMGCILSLIVMIAVFFLPYNIMRLFIDDLVVIELGVQYFKIILFSYIFTAVSFAISFNCRAIHRLNMPTIVNALAILLNTILNYLLIYGSLGFPKLGVRGAAIATLIARFVEFTLMIIFVYKDKTHPLAASFEELTAWNKDDFSRVIKTAFPVMVSEGSWSIGTSVYYIAFGYLGANAVAVVQVASIISDFAQSIFFGLGNACAVMIGNSIGRNEKDKSYTYGKRFLKINLIVCIVISTLLLIARRLIASFYDFDIETNKLLIQTIIVYALYTPPKMFTYMLFCGILRAGGDTKFCMYLDLISTWLMGIPLCFFSVKVLKLSLPLALSVTFGEELIKLVIVLKRFYSKKWINNLIS